MCSNVTSHTITYNDSNQHVDGNADVNANIGNDTIPNVISWRWKRV
jgi:hypothetical protein